MENKAQLSFYCRTDNRYFCSNQKEISYYLGQIKICFGHLSQLLLSQKYTELGFTYLSKDCFAGNCGNCIFYSLIKLVLKLYFIGCLCGKNYCHT